MPDLFTHFAAARLPGAALRDRRLQALLVIGTFLPDLAAKGLYWAFHSRNAFTVPSHSIAGVLLLSYLACLFLEEEGRRAGFLALAAGGLIHLVVDLIKDNQGTGAVFLWNPISRAGSELGWVDPENVILLVPLDLAILMAIWLYERKGNRVQQ